MARRGLTLLEIMIALALVVALGAITLPNVLRALDERAHDGAVQVLTNQLLLARAHAQTTGRPVEVVYLTDDARIVARPFDLTGAADDRDDPLTAPDSAALESPFPAGATREVDAIPEGWADHVFAEGVSVQREAPSDPNARPFDAAGFEGLGGLGPALDLDDGPFGESFASADAGADEIIRIAVYLPDGTTLLAAPVWIVGVDGLAGELTVNQWTGLPAYAPRGAAGSVEMTAPEEDAIEQDDEDLAPADPLEEDEEPADPRPDGDAADADEPRDGERESTGAVRGGEDAPEDDERGAGRGGPERPRGSGR